MTHTCRAQNASVYSTAIDAFTAIGSRIGMNTSTDDLRADMCIDMWTGMYTDMWTGMCTDMCTDMCTGMSIDTCIDDPRVHAYVRACACACFTYV